MYYKKAWVAFQDALVPLAEPYYLVVSACLTALAILTLPLELWIKPFARHFRLENPYINYPMVPEHVPVSLLAFLSAVLPLGFIFITGMVDKRTQKTCATSILGLSFALVATLFVTDVLKILIGNQRPDFIARCQPRPDAPKNQYVSVIDVCTTDNLADLWEGCKSTPSGHSSLSFAGLGYLAFWFERTFNLKRASIPLYLRISSYAPMLISAYVGFTRIIDHKHHWVDVISGSIIGTFIAWMSLKYTAVDSKAIQHSQSHNERV